MNKPTKFSSLKTRWGGQVLLLPRISIRHNTLTSMLALILLLWIISPAVAQDVTPTPEIPVIAPTGSTVDSVIVLVLMGVIVVISLGGTALIAYLVRLLGNSVKTEQLQGVLDSIQRHAYNQMVAATARTPQTWDDNLAPAVANFFGYNPNTPVPNRIPPRTIPPAPPVPEPVTQPKAQPLGVPLNTAYDLRHTTFHELAYDQKRVAVPTGYSYYAVTGDTAVHTDAFYDVDQGFKMMLDSRGKLNEHGLNAQFGYESLESIELYPGTRYTIAPHVDAKISGGAVNVRAALLDGDDVLLEFPPQRLDPGVYEDRSVVWVFQLSAGKAIFHLRLRVFVETDYATLHSESFIRWRMLPVEAQVPDYGSDAVVRY